MLHDACVMKNVLVIVISDLFIEEDFTSVIHYESLFEALVFKIYFIYVLAYAIYAMK